MYNKHEHFRQVKDVYLLSRICSEYVVSKTALCLCINNYLFGHNISILHKITYEFGRLPGKYILFFLNHKQRGY